MPSPPLPLRYRFTRWWMNAIARLTMRVEVRHLDRLPHTGPYIIVSNHLHLFDGPLLFSIVEDRDMHGFVGSTHRANPFYRFVVEPLDIIWLHRGDVDKTALTTALDFLKRGRILGVAPEGTRSKTGAMQIGKEGVAFLVSRARVPVYPCAITGTEKVFAAWKRLRRPLVTVTVGEPFDLTAIEAPERHKRLAVWTEEIMCRIAALLPPEYRGVYAGHPRLQELLHPPTG